MFCHLKFEAFSEEQRLENRCPLSIDVSGREDIQKTLSASLQDGHSLVLVLICYCVLRDSVAAIGNYWRIEELNISVIPTEVGG